MPSRVYDELGSIATVVTAPPNKNDTIPATIWGTTDDVLIEHRILKEGQAPELCVSFFAEGGYAGARLRVSDLLDMALKHAPELVDNAIRKARTPRDAI